MAEKETDPDRRSRSSLIAGNIRVGGRRTGIRLEPSMWEALQEVARHRALSVNELVTLVDRTRSHSTLTAAIRVFLLDHYRRAVQLAEAGGQKPSGSLPEQRGRS